MIFQKLFGEWDIEKIHLKMSKWYKKALLGNDLIFVISTWLRNAKNHPEIASANDDVSLQMGGADHQENLLAAIETASNIVSREQGGNLTPSQQELIQTLNNRTQDFSQVQDPFQMPPIDQGLDTQPIQDISQNQNGW